MFIIELLIYVFFAWVMYTIAKNAEMKTNAGETTGANGYMWAYILFFVFISAVRWRVGMDSPSYLRTFLRGIVRPDSGEYIWDWLVTTIYNNGIHFTVGLGISAFLQIYFIVKGCRNQYSILLWFPVVIFGSRYYLDMMNAVRQMIAACGFIYLSHYITDKKPIRYILGIILLSFIHHSVLMLVPLYLLTYINFNKWNLCNHRFQCLIIFFICVLIGQAPNFLNLVQYVEPITGMMGYDQYTSYYIESFGGNSQEKLSFGPIMLSTAACSAFVIWYSPKLYEKYSEKIQCFNIWYLLSFCFSTLYFLVCNLGHIVIRPVQYLEIPLAIMLSLLLNLFYSSDEKNHKTMFYILLCIIWASISADIYKSLDKPIEFALYKTIFGRL